MKIRVLAKESNGKKVPDGIRIENLPNNGIQHIHANVLERHKDHVEVSASAIVFHTVDGDVVFNIVQEPGRYCLATGKRLPDFAGNGSALESIRSQQCKEHVASLGASAVKTEQWPHGYSNRPNTFVCSIDDQRGA